jgi:hypothetical protein
MAPGRFACHQLRQRKAPPSGDVTCTTTRVYASARILNTTSSAPRDHDVTVFSKVDNISERQLKRPGTAICLRWGTLALQLRSKSDIQIRKSDPNVVWDEWDERRPHMWVPNSKPQPGQVAVPRSRNDESEIHFLYQTIYKAPYPPL